MSDSQILLYQSENGDTKVEVHLESETVWLTQAQMTELFQTDQSGISRHLKNIFESGELDEESNMQFLHTAESTKPVKFYNLDVIISVGYRVNSHRGVQFRIWATKTLNEYIRKGFVLDDERLSGRQGNYFDELIERVRRIRTSEANFYQKVLEIFATSIDYDPNAEIATTFFKTVQNKFHFAATGQTAAELIVNRANAYKPNMGLTSMKGKQVTRQDAKIAKNYYAEAELKTLQLLVDQFLSFAELQSHEQRPMYMSDWAKQLDDFLVFNRKQILKNAGSVSHKDMEQLIDQEYDVYQQKLIDKGEMPEAKPRRKSKKKSASEQIPLLPDPDED